MKWKIVRCLVSLSYCILGFFNTKGVCVCMGCVFMVCVWCVRVYVVCVRGVRGGVYVSVNGVCVVLEWVEVFGY